MPIQWDDGRRAHAPRDDVISVVNASDMKRLFWFLGEVNGCQVHWVGRSIPYLGDGCAICARGGAEFPRWNGYAAVLQYVAVPDKPGGHRWKPAILSVPERASESLLKHAPLRGLVLQVQRVRMGQRLGGPVRQNREAETGARSSCFRRSAGAGSYLADQGGGHR
jgi:hypothetical protein